MTRSNNPFELEEFIVKDPFYQIYLKRKDGVSSSMFIQIILSKQMIIEKMGKHGQGNILSDIYFLIIKYILL